MLFIVEIMENIDPLNYESFNSLSKRHNKKELQTLRSNLFKTKMFQYIDGINYVLNEGSYCLEDVKRFIENLFFEGINLESYMIVISKEDKYGIAIEELVSLLKKHVYHKIKRTFVIDVIKYMFENRIFYYHYIKDNKYYCLFRLNKKLENKEKKGLEEKEGNKQTDYKSESKKKNGLELEKEELQIKSDDKQVMISSKEEKIKMKSDEIENYKYKEIIDTERFDDILDLILRGTVDLPYKNCIFNSIKYCIISHEDIYSHLLENKIFIEKDEMKKYMKANCKELFFITKWKGEYVCKFINDDLYEEIKDKERISQYRKDLKQTLFEIRNGDKINMCDTVFFERNMYCRVKFEKIYNYFGNELFYLIDDEEIEQYIVENDMKLCNYKCKSIIFEDEEIYKRIKNHWLPNMI